MSAADDRYAATSRQIQAPEASWLARHFSLSTMITIVSQFVVLVALIVSMRSDIAIGKEKHAELERRVEKIAADSDRIVRIEERLITVTKNLDTLSDKFDRLLDRPPARK